MLYRTYTMISSVDLAHYGVSRAKDRVFVDCGTNCINEIAIFTELGKIQKKKLLYAFFGYMYTKLFEIYASNSNSAMIKR